MDGAWGGHLGLALPLFTEMLRLDGRVYYYESFNYEDGDGDLEIVPVDLGLQLHILPNGKLDPYLQAGVTYTFADGKDNDISIDDGFGGYIGVGLDWALMKILKPYAEFNYRFQEMDTNIDQLEANLTGWTGNVGLKLHF